VGRRCYSFRRKPVINNFLAIASDSGGYDRVSEEPVVLRRRQPFVMQVSITEMLPGYELIVVRTQTEIFRVVHGMTMVSNSYACDIN
jgi:hypothetical protein